MMKTRVYSLVMTVAMMTAASQPVVAQVLDDVKTTVEIVGGVQDIINKSKNSKGSEQRSQQESVTVRQSGQTSKTSQKGVQNGKRTNAASSSQGTVTLEGLLRASGQTPSQPAKGSKPQAPANGKRMKFLGLELGTDAKKFGQALISRGFTEGDGYSSNSDDIFLEGVVYEKVFSEDKKSSQTSQVSITEEDGLVREVSSIDYVSSEAVAKKRWEVYKKHIISEYGEGEVTYGTIYQVDLPYGTVFCRYEEIDPGEYEVIMKVSMN